MDDQKEILRERLRDRLSSTGKSAHAISVAIGANPGYVRDLLDPAKTGIPSAERLRLLAAELETTTDFLMGRAARADQPASEVSFRDVPLGWRAPPDRRIPVLGTGYCDDIQVDAGDDSVDVERLQLDLDHVVRLIDRPAALSNSPDAYAIYFHGSSMEPRFYQGEIGVVDPRRPPRPGDDVVVQLTNGTDGDIVTVLVKQLVKVTSRHIELAQFNPPLTFRLPRAQVARLHRLTSLAELLGA